MIDLKLTRDETRAVQTKFLTFLEQICDLDSRQALQEVEKQNAILITDIFRQVKKIFDRKLTSEAKKLKIGLKDSQAVVLYRLMMRIPLDPGDVWLCNLRQQICSNIHRQMK